MCFASQEEINFCTGALSMLISLLLKNLRLKICMVMISCIMSCGALKILFGSLSFLSKGSLFYSTLFPNFLFN